MSKERRDVAMEQETLVSPPARPSGVSSPTPLPLSTITLPVVRVPLAARRPTPRREPWYRDRWLVALIAGASCASIGAAWWAYTYHTALLYGDAHSHLLIARRVLDNATPGLAQLGNVWLPLPHLIMLPLAWIDALWRTGLAGTIPSMICFLIAACYVFLTARRLTWDSRASFIGALVFVLNPNVLYLQSTPLSEPALFATLAAASYYFVAWAQDERLRDLVATALCLFLSTLSRYDGWALYLAMLACTLLIGWMRRQSKGEMLAHLLLIGTLGGFGIVLWFVWNLIIFHSPIAFLNGAFSSEQQTRYFIVHGYADAYHNLWMAFYSYFVAVAESIGPIVIVLAVLAVIVFIATRRFSTETLGALTLLVPFAFYMAAFYLGQDVMYVPHADHPPYFLYNARFGAEMAAPAAVFLAVLVDWVGCRVAWGRLVVLALILGQTVCTAWGGVITLQDGQMGASCYPGHPVVAFLAQHYDGGRILIDTYDTSVDLSVAGITFQHEIYEGDHPLWEQALQQPSAYVEWIVTKPGDLIAQHIDLRSAAFHTQFVQVATDGATNPTAITLYRRTGLAPLAKRPLPPDVFGPYLACNRAKGFAIGLGAPPTRTAQTAPTAPDTPMAALANRSQGGRLAVASQWSRQRPPQENYSYVSDAT